MSIAIIVPEISPRLSYTIDWIFGRQLGLDYELLTARPEENGLYALVLSYGNNSGTNNIPCSGLLFEHTIARQEVATGLWQQLPVFFYTGTTDSFLPFDLFSAVFYLLSRYEEYLPFSPDQHQRYPATESILYRHQLLDRPIIDEWMVQLGKKLKNCGVTVQQKRFSFLPTYDIDIAWSYLHKGWKRTLGGYVKSVSRNDFEAVKERTSVWRGHKADPFDSFAFTDQLHQALQLKPVYFILMAKQNGPFDKHILPSQPDMKKLIIRLSAQYETGIHPSYRTSDQPGLLSEEHALMEQVTGKKIQKSRQHYIRFRLPETYRTLLKAGIQEDYSMGYGTHIGFRAGTSHPFDWYDLPAEQKTGLRVFPFSFMDTTAHYDLKLNTAAAFEKLKQLQTKLQECGGMLVTIFHNFSLGTAHEWQGWQQAYTDFIKQVN